MSGKIDVEKGIYECALVMKIVNAKELLNSLVGSLYSGMVRDEIVENNELLKECFGKGIMEYSKDEVDDLVAEYILLFVKE